MSHHKGSVGIYLDNGSSGYTLHHNVIWNAHDGIRIRAATEQFIYNNTILDVTVPIEHRCEARRNAKIITQNNLASLDGYYGITATHNQVV